MLLNISANDLSSGVELTNMRIKGVQTENLSTVHSFVKCVSLKSGKKNMYTSVNLHKPV